MAWFRVYDDVLDDPKIQMLSDRAFRMLVNLWCLAKRNGGIITDDLNSISFSLRWPISKVRDTLKALINAKLVDRIEGGYEPHNWNGRQFESDNAADRMRRYRQRNKEREGDEPLRNDKRNSERNGDAKCPVPDTEQNRTEQNRTDDDEERARAKSILGRVCEILGLELRADPDRLTWDRQILEMLRDGIPELDIIRGAETARTRGVPRLSYVREVALHPAKIIALATGPPKANGADFEERFKAKMVADDEQERRLRGGD